MNTEIIYLKLNRKAKSDTGVITVNDIAKVTCGSDTLKAKIEDLTLLTCTDGNTREYVISVMKVIEIITTAFPLTQIVSLGEESVYIEFSRSKSTTRTVDIVMTILVTAITFFGSAFTIMAFHNDIDITQIFADVYEKIAGKPSSGFTVLEISYSIGLGVGIIVFFNHFGGFRLTADPTPVEVEMFTYENEITDTKVDDCEQKGNVLDVE